MMLFLTMNVDHCSNNLSISRNSIAYVKNSDILLWSIYGQPFVMCGDTDPMNEYYYFT